MDTRRRISFNMNTGGGQPSTGVTYTVNLNGQWEKTTVISNPDSTLYDGVYQSSANKGVPNSGDIMYIDIEGLETFKLYIRCYAEPNYDYVMVSQLDKTLTYQSSYSDTSLVKAHTLRTQNSGTTIDAYQLVEFTGIDGGKHRISIIYRKDSSNNSGDDRGYVLIPKSNGSSGDEISGPINTDNYMTILALEDGLTASLSKNACQYCIDGDGNWIDLPKGTTTQSINSGQTLSFRGNLPSNIGTFTISKKCNLEGNCMSLLFGDDAENNNSLFGKAYAFYRLFSGCTTIIQVSESFLPATRLAHYCYDSMFYNCTSLTTAPELPATTLDVGCYDSMFYNCTKLNYIKMLATNIVAGGCLNNWVVFVPVTGTFVKNPAMTSLSIGDSGIPLGWTVLNDGEESGEDGGEDSGLTFPIYMDLNNATQIDEGYYEFEPSELSQALLDWTQELGLNFDADHTGGSTSVGSINLTNRNENYKIIIGDYELTSVTTDVSMSDICFYNAGWTCELCIAKDNSYVEFYIY